jgi:hypothetical protein
MGGAARVVVAGAAAAAEPAKAGAEEVVLQPIREISGTVKLPGSKSLSNRILLLAALAEVRSPVLGWIEIGCGDGILQGVCRATEMFSTLL